MGKIDKERIWREICNAVDQPGAKLTAMANFFPSRDGEYWTAYLVSRPCFAVDRESGLSVDAQRAIPKDIQDSGNGENLRLYYHLEDVVRLLKELACHSDTFGSLRLARFHLLAAVFHLWSLEDSFPISDKKTVEQSETDNNEQ